MALVTGPKYQKLKEMAGRRTFLRRTKATPAPDTPDDVPTTLPTTIDNEKLPKRGGSRFKYKESTRNETSAGNRRPSSTAGARRSERPPTRNFVRRRLGGANATTTTTTTSPSASSPSSTTRRPFRIASRRRNTTTTTTTTSSTTTQATTLTVDSEESLQDVGDIDAIEDPSLEPRVPKKSPKTPRRPLVNLKEELKDQNPSATNEDERKRQSKKYSSSFKQNQLDDLLKVKSEEITTEIGTTVEEYNAETAIAIATHQLITAPLPGIPDYEEGTKPTRTKTTQKYKETNPEYSNTPTYEEYSTVTYKTNPTSQDFVQTTAADAYSIYDSPSLTTFYEDPKTTADFTVNSRRPAYTASYEPKTTYDFTKTTEDVATTDSRQPSTQDIDLSKVTTFVLTDSFSTTVGRQAGYTNIPTSYEPRISTTFEVPKQSGTLNRYPTTPVYQAATNQYVPTTRDYADIPERLSSFSTPTPLEQASRDFETPARSSSFSTLQPLTKASQGFETSVRSSSFSTLQPLTKASQGFETSVRSSSFSTLQPLTKVSQGFETPEGSPSFSTLPPIAKASRGFSSPNVITPGYSGIQRGGTKYLIASEKSVTPEDIGYSTSGYKSSSQDPTYFTREYLLESPVTKTYDDEYQYLSPTTPQTPRKVFRKKIQRRISTTLRPTSTTAYIPEVTTTPRPARVPSRRPFEKVSKVEPNRTYRPVVNYDYYDDSAEKVALKYAEGTKVILHGKGSIECLDVGNFPHPSSCKKFISCARMEFGSLLGWEYVCPKGLSFDPVGGICNWSAGLGCDEKDD